MATLTTRHALEPKMLSIEDLLTRDRDGQLRMPHFERPLVWRARDVKLLLESIHQGYPIGMLLFWQRSAHAGTTRWGAWLQDVPDEPRAWWIVDGQHRIASLVLSMLQPPDRMWGLDPRFAWYWNVQKERLEQPPTRGVPVPAFWLPLHCVGDMIALIGWGEVLLKANGTVAEVEAGRRWARHMADYKLLCYVTEAVEESDVRQIFDRTNSTGRSLGAADVFHGLHAGGEEVGAPSLATLAAAMGDLSFGPVPRDLLLKALLAIQNLNITNLKQSVHALDSAEAPRLMSDTSAAMRWTVEFLREECEIPTIALVPYELAIVVLARFFHLHPHANGRSRILLRRWLWRAAASGEHAMGNRTTVRQSVSAIRPNDEEGSVQRLLATVSRNAPPWVSGPFQLRRVTTKIEILAMLTWQPRDLTTGELLDIGELFARDPSGAVKMRLVTQTGMATGADDTANRLLHPAETQAPKLLLSGCTDAAVLASHGLTRADSDALSAGRYGPVLHARQARIDEARATLLALHCEWERNDRPSIDWLEHASAHEEAA